MKVLFVDTSGWLSIVNTRDVLNKTASTIYLERFRAGWEFITHSGVMLEVGNSLAATHSRALALELKERIGSSSRMRIMHVTPELYEAGWQLYGSRQDKEWGLVDCVSFVLMEQMNISEALTADKHFTQAGFVRLLERSST